MKLNTSQKLWWAFTWNVFLALCMAGSMVFISNLMLHQSDKTNQSFIQKLPVIKQHIQEEQDVAKLRSKANGLLDTLVSSSNNEVQILHFAVTLSWMFGFILIISSLSCGLFTYRLQREVRKELVTAKSSN